MVTVYRPNDCPTCGVGSNAHDPDCSFVANKTQMIERKNESAAHIASHVSITAKLIDQKKRLERLYFLNLFLAGWVFADIAGAFWRLFT